VNEDGGPLPKQPDEDGSSRSLILRLLLDHCLLLYPHQLARLKTYYPRTPWEAYNHAPAWTTCGPLSGD
jgi:hypothetical protein